MLALCLMILRLATYYGIVKTLMVKTLGETVPLRHWQKPFVNPCKAIHVCLMPAV